MSKDNNLIIQKNTEKKESKERKAKGFVGEIIAGGEK
jgi:hypothetical protein